MNTVDTAFPYQGFLYLVGSPEMTARGHAKIGGTSQSMAQRCAGHSGQLTLDRSTPEFIVEAKDWPQAEALAKARLRQEGFFVANTGKELIWRRDLERVMTILKESVDKASVRTAKRLSPDVARELTTSQPAWHCLLQMPVSLGSTTFRLGQWMAQAVRLAPVAKKLEKRGLLCTNNDAQAPEFTLTQVLPLWETWLSSHGFDLAQLMDPESARFTQDFAFAA